MISLFFVVATLLLPPDYTAGYRASVALTVEEQQLAEHIKHIYPKAPYAELLACRIMREARDFGLDPTLFAAIAWTESGYRMDVKGSAGEIGLWQILPGHWLAGPWEHLQATDQLVGYPEKSWGRLGKQVRHAVLSEIVSATYFAAWLVSYHLAKCGEHTARCYAMFNSGNLRVQPYYVRCLAERSKVIRKHLWGE